MTSWQVGGIVFGMVAYVVAWFRGGRPERFAVGILLFNSLLSCVAYNWDVDVHLFDMALDGVRLLIFGWLCFRLDRWWPFVITAALALIVVTHFARLLDPAVTRYVMISAQVGLGYLIDLTLLVSVCERWLAGEPPAGTAAWAKADRATAARRNRRDRAARAAVDRERNTGGLARAAAGRSQPKRL